MTKDTLFLTSHKFKLVKKDRLFYDKYHYCLTFFLAEANCMRELDHEKIDQMLHRKKEWREMAQQRWAKSTHIYSGLVGHSWQEITEKTKQDLHSVAKILLESPAEFKLVVSTNQGYVYSNDLNMIDRLDSMPELQYKSYTQANIIRQRNTVQLRNCQRQFRSYFRRTKLSGHQKQQLSDFLYSQQGPDIRLSPALTVWLVNSFNHTQDYFFVDHNGENWTTMLSLVLPGILRKTMHIIPAK